MELISAGFCGLNMYDFAKYGDINIDVTGWQEDYLTRGGQDHWFLNNSWT